MWNVSRDTRCIHEVNDREQIIKSTSIKSYLLQRGHFYCVIRVGSYYNKSQPYFRIALTSYFIPAIFSRIKSFNLNFYLTPKVRPLALARISN